MPVLLGWDNTIGVTPTLEEERNIISIMSLQDKKKRSMMKHAHTQYQLFKRERERETYLGRRGVGGALDWHDPRKGLSGTV